MNSEQIANKIEQAIGETLSYAVTIEVEITNYSLFYNSDRDASWHVVFWVNDPDTLQSYIDHGKFYYIHQFLHPRITAIKDGISASIRIDCGKAPETEEEYEKLLNKILYRHDPMNDESGRATLCRHCGHSWGGHQLRGFPAEGEKVPTKGWMVCPELDCNCFLTWDAEFRK